METVIEPPVDLKVVKSAKNKERGIKYYSNEDNKKRHAEYMKNYHLRNKELLKGLKKMIKAKEVEEEKNNIDININGEDK